MHYHTPLLFGTSSAIVSSIESYVDAGQAIGMLGGLRSAAEYEILVGRKGSGVASVDAQRSLYVFILFVIILGNIIFASIKLSKRVRKRLKLKRTALLSLMAFYWQNFKWVSPIVKGRKICERKIRWVM